MIDTNPNSPNFNTVVDTISVDSSTGIAITTEIPPDTDNDGFADGLDNCPSVFNPDQTDTDNNGVGDACNNAEDADGDEWADNLDNCPGDSNADQSDADMDHVGDVCDPFLNDSNNRAAQCEDDLDTTQTALSHTQTDLGVCQTDLGEKQTELQQALATIEAMRSCLAHYKKENGVRCRDGRDNDCDGLTDDDDPDCGSKRKK